MINLNEWQEQEANFEMGLWGVSFTLEKGADVHLTEPWKHEGRGPPTCPYEMHMQEQI